MKKNYIAIVDYGYGNLHSAQNAFREVMLRSKLAYDVIITNQADKVLSAERIVLPGQGAFGSCMTGLESCPGMIEALTESVIQKGTPFLGICVGMQLLARAGHENGLYKGLGWLDGEVVPLRPENASLKIPHMGWNRIFTHSTTSPHTVLKSLTDKSHFYFVHSFMFKCKDNKNELAYTEYGEPVTAVVGRDNFLGVQFHPEKSHHDGLSLIQNFLEWSP